MTDIAALVGRILDRADSEEADRARLALLLSASQTVTRNLDLASALQQVVVTVTDDGIGIPPAVQRSGLENLRARAVELGGTFAVGAASPRGTQLRWVAPWKAE